MKLSLVTKFRALKKACVLAFVLYVPFESWAQKPPEIIPPSPTAAALGKYGDIPVSLYTGIPSVDIPIYTLAGSHLKLPISLSYHASGLKVDENASWGGLGFSLNAGGVITRTTKSLRDEVTGETKGYLTNDPIPAQPDMLYYFNEVLTGKMDTEPDLFFFNFNGYSGKFFLDKKEQGSNIVKGYSIPYKDLDITCVFTADMLSEFTIVTEDGTQYKFNTPELTTTHTYHYEANTAIPFIKSDKTATAISAWYLTEIRSSVGQEVISFSYVPEKYKYETPKRGEAGYMSKGMVEYRTMSYSENTIQGVRLSNIRFEKIKTTIEFKAEKERTDLLVFPDGQRPMALEEVVVKYDGKEFPIKRYQLVTSYFRNSLLDNNIPPIPASQHYLYQRLRLDKVIELSSDGLLSHPPYVFEYNEAMIPPKNAETQDHWGFYNGPQKVFNADQYYSKDYMMPAYSGEINTEEDAVYIARWCELSGEYQFTTIPINLKSYQNIRGVNREPNASSMQVSILNKITYPTGGTTDMVYEPHRYGYIADEQYDKVVYAKSIPNAIIERPWDNNPTLDEIKTFDFIVPEAGLYKVEFAVEFAYKNEIDFNNGWAYTKNEVSLTGAGLPHPLVRIYWDNLDGQYGDIYSHQWEEGMTIPRTVPLTTLATGSVEYEGYIDDVFDGDGEHYARKKGKGFFIVKLQPNITYTLKAHRKYDASLHCYTPGTCYENNTEAAIFLDKEIETGDVLYVDKQRLAGGLRIQKVTSQDGFGGEPLTTEYSYMQTDEINNADTDRSSGCLLSWPEHTKTEAWFVDAGLSEAEIDQAGLRGSLIMSSDCHEKVRHVYALLKISSDYQVPLSTTQGSHIGYREVRTRQPGNGSTITKFLSGYEHPDDYANEIHFTSKNEIVGDEAFIGASLNPKTQTQYQGFLPKVNNDWKRGFEDVKITISENNEELVKEDNNYTFENKKVIEGLQVFWNARDPNPPYLLLKVQYARYQIVSGWGYLNSKTITEQTPAGDIVQTVSYTHDSPNHIQLTKEVRETSEEKTEEINYVYVADKPVLANTPSTVLDQMVNKNMIYGLAKKEVKTEGTLVHGVITNFKLDQGNYVPSSQEVYEGLYREKLKYDVYSSSGNLLQYTPSNKIPTAFIWDNTGTIPLAKVINAESGRIFFDGFEESGTIQEGVNTSKTGNRYLNSGSYNFSSQGSFNPTNTTSLKMTYWYWNAVLAKWVFSGERNFATSINAAADGGSRLDEIRVYPEGAQMSTYSYDPLVGIVSQTDSNNISQYYKYDKYGRLEFIRDDKGNILKKYTYHYSGE